MNGAFSEASLDSLVSRLDMNLVAPLRRRAEQAGLNAAERYMMNVLMADAPQDIAGINAVMDHTGVRVTAEMTKQMIRRDLIARVDPGAAFRLTDSGRPMTVEILVIAKAMELDAVSGLNEDEQQLLRALLSRMLMRDDDGRVTRHMDLTKLALRRATVPPG